MFPVCSCRGRETQKETHRLDREAFSFYSSSSGWVQALEKKDMAASGRCIALFSHSSNLTRQRLGLENGRQKQTKRMDVFGWREASLGDMCKEKLANIEGRLDVRVVCLV
jgi:hypothetical protein